MRIHFYLASIIAILLVVALSRFWPPLIWALTVVVPVILWGFIDVLQTKHTLLRNFPIAAKLRYVFEDLRPKIYQYFIESDLDGRPINRSFRSIVYQRAKSSLDTLPFGTQLDVYRVGYEWINHSMAPLLRSEIDWSERTLVGGPDCKQPYSASVFNISAMSFGALSSRAIMALNKGAKIGEFAHNTGEGGLSHHHLKHGGDLIWQIGTAYFGCRTKDGKFCPDTFKEKAVHDAVKMIEVKLSQGAKPGHGGILPAQKNTKEIAEIRGLHPHTIVESPGRHMAFDGPEGLLKFIEKLRKLSGGKPVGFKLCVGRRNEFFNLAKLMVDTGIKPDFITVDGGEGGTGAAPLEFSNSVGVPLREGLAFVVDVLRGFDLKKDIKVFASGKMFTGFQVVKNLAVGADACYSARGMMLALGCIQARECNNNTCPVGVATQNKMLVAGLDVDDKAERVASFHKETVESVLELLAASGLKSSGALDRTYINRRVSTTTVARFDEVYPIVEEGCFLKGTIPDTYKGFINYAKNK